MASSSASRPRGGDGIPCTSRSGLYLALPPTAREMADKRLMEQRVHVSQLRGHINTEADGTQASHQETGITKNNSRARWTHPMKMFLIGLLKDYDVPGFRTQNAWSKEAWTNIVSRLNQKFNLSFTVLQVKQKEQDLKKDYRSVKDLLDESGFGWNSERNMVDAPDNVWDSFAARKNSKDALQWRDKSFPYYDELIPLYEVQILGVVISPLLVVLSTVGLWC